MKRMIYFLMAIYVLFLVAIPCQDEVQNAMENTQETLINQQISKTSTSESFDFCTPVCICSCCTGSTIVSFQKLYEVTEPIPFFSSKVIFSYLSRLPESKFSAIWQPPQLRA